MKWTSKVYRMISKVKSDFSELYDMNFYVDTESKYIEVKAKHKLLTYRVLRYHNKWSVFEEVYDKTKVVKSMYYDDLATLEDVIYCIETCIYENLSDILEKSENLADFVYIDEEDNTIYARVDTELGKIELVIAVDNKKEGKYQREIYCGKIVKVNFEDDDYTKAELDELKKMIEKYYVNHVIEIDNYGWYEVFF